MKVFYCVNATNDGAHTNDPARTNDPAHNERHYEVRDTDEVWGAGGPGPIGQGPEGGIRPPEKPPNEPAARPRRDSFPFTGRQRSNQLWRAQSRRS